MTLAQENESKSIGTREYGVRAGHTTPTRRQEAHQVNLGLGSDTGLAGFYVVYNAEMWYMGNGERILASVELSRSSSDSGMTRLIARFVWAHTQRQTQRA